ncbi:MAG: clostripain-related cysteine peptidase, partial [Burkholderiales bacterium]
GDALTMAELRLALERAGFGKGLKGKLALLGFDACLMNMVEVAYEFIGLAEIVVGSQQTEPGDGWPYGDVVGGLHRRPDPQTAAANIVNSYDKYYRRTAQPNVTQSAIQLARLPAVGKALDRLATALLAALPDARAAIVEARVRTQGYEEPTYVDLTDLARNLRSIPGSRVRAACDATIAAVKPAIIANKRYGGAVDRSKGLSVWFPLIRTDYATRRSEYVALRYTKDYPAWSKFLDRLLAS